MTRARFAGLREGEHTLPADVAHHLTRVLRLKAGARITLFDPDQKTEAEATLVSIESDARVLILVGTLQPARAIATTELVLVYALAKGDKVDAVVRDATELGATRIILTQTSRSVVDVRKKEDQKKDRWERIALEAARQCGRADPPQIDLVLKWEDALESAAATTDAAATAPARFCLDPRAVSPLRDALATAIESKSAITFAIGPEGGLSADEIEIAIARGYLPVSLGPFILRTETVAAAVLGAVRILSPQ